MSTKQDRHSRTRRLIETPARSLSMVSTLLALATAIALPVTAQTGSLDCAGPAPEAEPGTPEWFARDAQNILCAQQRHADAIQHPVLGLPIGEPVDERGRAVDDAYREPSRHADVRFRFEETTVTTPSGQTLAVELYRPCDAASCPDLSTELTRFEPPYPAVVSVHGGASRKELHWWSSQPLAESGYMVVSFDDATTGTSPSEEQVNAIVDWLFATPASASTNGEFNPRWQDLNRNLVGIAGHSAGGRLASLIGQQDQRLSAIVSWDRAQSSAMPDDLVLDTPAMFHFADYNCQQVPICQPQPYLTAPDPNGPGNKGEDFVRIVAAGLDSMQIAIRAATHLDWTPPALAGSRYGEMTSLYFTLAWFDRHLRGADDPSIANDAHARLTAPVFDRSADIHNISQGLYDPLMAALATSPYAGNLPYTLEGMPVTDRLSYYYRSKCRLTPPDGSQTLRSDDLSTSGCGDSSAARDSRGGGAPGLFLLMVGLGFGLRRNTPCKTERTNRLPPYDPIT